jgi:diguanylate cyclase (GGDEF)-like protein/PAS domain S-box-containing protein
MKVRELEYCDVASDQAARSVACPAQKSTRESGGYGDHSADVAKRLSSLRAPDSSSLLETMRSGYAHCHMVYDEQGSPVDWVHLAVNPAFVRLTGLRDAIGKTVTELIPGIRESCPQFFDACARVASGHASETLEIDFRPLSLWLHMAISSPAPGYFFAVFEDVTERKRMESALELSRLSLDCSGDMIHWLAADGRILYASDSSVKRLGYTREELLGRTVLDLDPTMTSAKWAKHWRELKAAGSLAFETVYVNKSGETFPIEITANYLEQEGKEYNFSFGRDITERRKLESSLRLTQLSVDRAADLIHWVDSRGNLLYVSDSTCERHGYSREDLLSMTVFDLDPVLTRTTWEAHWQDLKQQGSVWSESVHRTKGGELFPVEVVRNYVCQGAEEYDFIYARDISRRKKAEQELNRTRVALETRNRELEEAGRRIEKANEELRAARDALAVQARTDPLTGCLNRGAILARLEEELARSDRDGTPLAVGMLDIDHFKDINDTFGHPVGDAVLREVVARSLGALRPYDVFGRFGGEEFLMVITSTDNDKASQIFERVRAAIESTPVKIDGHGIHVTASIGGVAREAQPAEGVVRLADAALYTAKAHGRNRVEMAGIAGAREARRALTSCSWFE